MQPPFHRLEEFVELNAEDLEFVKAWGTTCRRIERNRAIRREGDPVEGVFFLMSGWVGSSIMLRGGKRQIVKIHLQGDMLGFPSLSLAAAGETLEALTQVDICPIPNRALANLIEKRPRIATGLLLSSQKERVALMHKISWIGSASATERLTAFLLDLYDRLEAADLVDDHGFEHPLTQQHIGDLLGLTAVHVNRTLKELEVLGYIIRDKRRIRFTDLKALRMVAPNFPPKYAGRDAWLRLAGEKANSTDAR